MAESLLIEQRLAAELGLPEAKYAPPETKFPVACLLEWQEEFMRKRRERQMERKQSAFLAPVPVAFGQHSYGVLRRDD